MMSSSSKRMRGSRPTVGCRGTAPAVRDEGTRADAPTAAVGPHRPPMRSGLKRRDTGERNRAPDGSNPTPGVHGGPKSPGQWQSTTRSRKTTALALRAATWRGDRTRQAGVAGRRGDGGRQHADSRRLTGPRSSARSDTSPGSTSKSIPFTPDAAGVGLGQLADLDCCCGVC